MIRPAPFRWPLLIALPLLGCYTAVPEVAEPAAPAGERTSYAARKTELVQTMERRMNELMRRSLADLAAIRGELERDLDRIMPPVRLLAVERSFRAYGAAAEEIYAAEIERLVDRAVERTEALVGRRRAPGVEPFEGAIADEAWHLAAEIGGGGRGAGYGFVSGVREVDERAEVTIELLRASADVDGLRDLGAIRRAESIECSQTFRHDVLVEEITPVAPRTFDQVLAVRPSAEGGLERVGRLILFQSDVLEDFRMPRHDTVAVVIGFQNDRLPESHDLMLVQATRQRVVRGGVIVLDLPWELDDTVPGRDGLMPLQPDLVDPRFLATAPLFPVVDVDHPRFNDLRDFTVYLDYTTGILDVTTRELLGSIDWQLSWVVSATGEVRFIEPAAAAYDPAAPVLTRLLDGAGMAAEEEEPRQSPRDLLLLRVVPEGPAVEPPLREFPDGAYRPIVEHVGVDHVRVPRHGRDWLLAHRLRVFATGVDFLVYYDGARRRDVVRLVGIPEDSPVRDLGFRVNDDVLTVNGVAIPDVAMLFRVLAENPRERHFQVDLTRDGAQRRLDFDVFVPPEGDVEELPAESLTPAMGERLDRLFGDGDAGGRGPGGA